MSTQQQQQPAISSVDPWEIQRTLMEASAQPLPEEPQINKGVLLYGALILEEGSETMAGLYKAMAEIPGASKHLESIRKHFEAIAQEMHQRSIEIREELKAVPNDFTAAVSAGPLRELADGTTDVAVVNSGFSLALGLDGAALYREVNGSNLSKRNPATGKIDKTPDGKWIKGPDYYEPDVMKVVAATIAQRAARRQAA
jgi:predicted HAD superfamily Cof-like phosphohydrolase